MRAGNQRRIDTNEWAAGFNPPRVAPMPYRITHDGVSNWMANVGATATPGYEGLDLGIVARCARERFPPQSLGDTIARLPEQQEVAFLTRIQRQTSTRMRDLSLGAA